MVLCFPFLKKKINAGNGLKITKQFLWYESSYSLHTVFKDGNKTIKAWVGFVGFCWFSFFVLFGFCWVRVFCYNSCAVKTKFLPLFTTKSEFSNDKYLLYCVTKQLSDWAEIQWDNKVYMTPPPNSFGHTNKTQKKPQVRILQVFCSSTLSTSFNRMCIIFFITET